MLLTPRSILSLALLAFQVCGASSSHAQDDNISSIEQIGAANRTTIQQRYIASGIDGANSALVVQQGANNAADITQDGDRNSAVITQHGSDQTATITQHGSGAVGEVHQGAAAVGGISMTQDNIYGAATGQAAIVSQN